MIVTVDDHEQLVAVVDWAYSENKWGHDYTLIIVHNLGDVNLTQLLAGHVHVRFPIFVNIESTHIRLYHVEDFPEFLPDLSYNDWEDLFN